MSSLRLMVVLLGCGAPWAIAFSASPDTQEIDKLIKQLGDEKFLRREAACKALEEIGAPALDPLRRACDDPDPEVQRRAKDLVRLIERRMEREEILRPTLVRLNLKDVSVPDAVAELAKQSGYSILLGGNAAKLQPDKKITLHTPEVSFWEALELLCLKADLTHPVNTQPLRVQHPGEVGTGNVRIPQAVPGQRGTAIVLVPGTPPRYPTYYAGALRIRVLPPGSAKDAGLSEEVPGETVMTLEVCLEPKLLGHDILDISVAKALDDRNQPLAHIPLPVPRSQAGPEERVVVRNGNQIIVRQVIVNRPSELSDTIAQENLPRLIPLRFKLPEQPGQVLADLQATLAAQVRTPILPLVTVEDVTAAVGKELAGRDGVSVSILACTLGKGGEVMLGVRVIPNAIMAQGLNPNVPVQIVPNQQMPLNAVRMGVAATMGAGFSLTDSDGNPYKLVSSQTNQTFGPTGWILDYRLIYRPQDPKAQPKRFTLSASRVAAIELPFALRNIPLNESH